jgi:IS605 OrfB family transposase
MQEAGQTAFNDVFRDKEQRFVHDQLHTVSRRVVEWIQRLRFDSPVIVFEDPTDMRDDIEYTDMRDDIEYGTRMNRRLHSLPFAKLRDFITYKAAWRGIPSDDVDPEYTSQQCPVCGHTERANRHKKRFKCCECGHQDHADRGAGVSVGQKWLRKQNNRL